MGVWGDGTKFLNPICEIGAVIAKGPLLGNAGGLGEADMAFWLAVRSEDV